MAKDIATISKANGGKTKQSLATYKAKHRQYSAAADFGRTGQRFR
jgi:hypothetical protein